MNESMITRGTAVLLAAMLLLGTFQGGMQLHGVVLDERMLSRIVGAIEFWKDPCTWDGFAVGAGIVLCLSWNVGGCVTAVSGFTRALRYDNCF